MGIATDSSIRIVIPPGAKLYAHLIIKDPSPEVVTVETITALLQEHRIPITEAITNLVNQVVRDARCGELTGEPIVLVEGKAPVPGTPASIELASDKKEDHSEEVNGRVDFRQSHIVIVNEGEEIGTYTPQIPPTPGVDIFGQPIPGAPPKNSVGLGENVKLADDGKTIIATTAGKVQQTRGELSVVEVVEIKGDVDYESGNVLSPTNVVITGTVRDAFTVSSQKSVSVLGAIEASDVEAGTHVQVTGGITARGKGKVRAGGEICAKFCAGADLKANRDIIVTRQIMNSRVHTGGRLTVDRGALIGGYAYAREGATIKELGNDANLKTEIAVGVDPVVLAKITQADETIAKKKEAAQKIRSAVEPLLAQIKRLTPDQRERATELMFEADAMDASVAEYEQNKQKMVAANSPDPDSRPSILVLFKLFAGVRVIFGNKISKIDKNRQGPIKIERRVVDRVEEIVIVDQSSGSVTTLPSYEYEVQLPQDESQLEPASPNI